MKRITGRTNRANGGKGVENISRNIPRRQRDTDIGRVNCVCACAYVHAFVCVCVRVRVRAYAFARARARGATFVPRRDSARARFFFSFFSFFRFDL